MKNLKLFKELKSQNVISIEDNKHSINDLYENQNNITSFQDYKINREKESLTAKENQKMIKETFRNILKIKKITTEITVHSDSPDGYVSEKVNFEIAKGKFNKIIKRFSLVGTSDKLHSFRISSSYVYFL